MDDIPQLVLHCAIDPRLSRSHPGVLDHQLIAVDGRPRPQWVDDRLPFSRGVLYHHDHRAPDLRMVLRKGMDA